MKGEGGGGRAGLRGRRVEGFGFAWVSSGFESSDQGCIGVFKQSFGCIDRTKVFARGFLKGEKS